MWIGALPRFLPWATPLLRERRTIAWALCLAAVLGSSLFYQLWTLTEGDTVARQTMFRGQDADTVLILHGLETTPSIRDTVKWWTGVWTGQVPFWRPLPSMLFWTELKLFGYDFRWWGLVSVVLSVILAALVLGALEPLLGTEGATATVLVAFVGFTSPSGLGPPMWPAVSAWKHQVDLLCGIWLFIALWIAVKGRPLLSLAPIALAAASKETGFIGFLLVPAVLWWWRWRGGEVPSLRRFVLWGVPLALALGVWHWMAAGLGYRLGTNEFWWSRAAVFWGGRATSEALWGGWHLVALVAVGAVTVWIANRRGLWAILVLVAGTAATLVVKAIEAHLDLVTTTTMVLLVQFPRLLAVLMCFLGAYIAWRFSRWEVALGLAVMVLGSALTFAATQTLEHSRWLGGVGHAILAWAVIRGAWEAAPLAARGLKEGLGLGRPQGSEAAEGESAASTDGKT